MPRAPRPALAVLSTSARLGLLLGAFSPLQPAASQQPTLSDTLSLVALQPEPPPEDDALRTLSRAEGLLDLGRPTDAADLLAGVDLEGPHGTATLTLRAWALLRAERHAEVLALLGDDVDAEGDRTVGRVANPELLYLRGAAHRAAGNGPAALADLRRLWWGEAEGVWGLFAMRELSQLPAAAGGPYSSAERKLIERCVRAPSYRPSTAVADIDATLRALATRVPKGALAGEVRHALGARLLATENHEQAAQELQLALRLSRNPGFRRAIELRLGEAERRRGAYRVAMEHFDRVAAGGDDHLTHEAQALAGQMAIEFRRYPEARKRFQAQLVGNPVGVAREQALWGLGWVAFRTGDYTTARQFFRTLFTESEFGPYAAQSLYWGARAAQEIDDQTTAQQELAYLIAVFPLDYYAYRAAELLRVSDVRDAHYPSGPLELDEAVDYIAQLTSAGMPKRAVRALPKLEGKLEYLGPHELRALQTALETLRADRWLGRVRWQRHTRFPEGEEARALLTRLFPARTVSMLAKLAKEHRLTAPLVVALVRQESAFNARATSGVGAVGLMQLMVPTARELLREERRITLTAEALMDPELNAHLGMKYLGRMLRSFAGRVEYALAAYNAGPGAVTRWRQQHGDLPADIFVEEIPYAETRAYVRRILAGMRTYAYVASPAEKHASN